MSNTASTDNKDPVYLEPDDAIRGQDFVCLSFLTPNRGLIRDKNLFFFSKFLEFYQMDYKIKASEGFIMEQFRTMQNSLADIELRIRNSTVDSENAEALAKRLSDEITALRGEIAKKSAADMEAYVKGNLSDFKESTIVENYEKYMLVNRQRLEDEFHKQKNFQTTMHGLKVRGVFSSKEQATARAKALNKKDPYHSVYVADVGQWLPWDPSPDEIPDQEYNDSTDEGKRLNDLMRTYRENAEKRDAFFEEEKAQKIAAAAAAVKAAKEKLNNEETVPDVAQGIFSSSGEPDLAIARKREAAANTISHV